MRPIEKTSEGKARKTPHFWCDFKDELTNPKDYPTIYFACYMVHYTISVEILKHCRKRKQGF